MQTGKYPNTYYRVSIKAIIRNESNEVLVVKENDSEWSLPGGGMDFGESVHQTLERELYEELLITSPFSEKFAGIETTYLEEKDAWIMWVAFELEFEHLTYELGKEVKEARFVDVEAFADKDNFEEQFTYRLSTKKA